MRSYNVHCRADGFLGIVRARDIFAAEEAAKYTWPECELVVTARI